MTFKRTLVVAILLLLTLSLAAVRLMTSELPLIGTPSVRPLGQADTVQPLLAQFSQLMNDRHRSHQITITPPQVASLLAVLHRATPAVWGDAQWLSDALVVQLTIDLDQLTGVRLWAQRFVNIELVFVSDERLTLEQAMIGRLQLPGQPLLSLAGWVLNRHTQTQIGHALLTRVERVDISREQALLQLLPIEPVITEYKAFKKQRQEQPKNALTSLTSDYVAMLLSSGWAPAGSTAPLSTYMAPVFQHVSEQPLEQQALHAQAAVLALAAVVGHGRVATLVGLSKLSLQLPDDITATLLARNDLARHYIISAALNVLSYSAMSLAIGEFKELMDRGYGGSGYSFIDLAADMAGNALAESLRDDNKRSEVIDTLRRRAPESSLMPEVAHLPEGLTAEDFRRVFGEVDSPQYRQLVDSIADEIMHMPLYRLSE